MTRINLRGLVDALPAPAPVERATVTVQRWSGHEPAVFLDADSLVFPIRVPIILDADDPAPVIDVPPTDGRYCIRWTITAPIPGMKPIYRYTTIPNGAAVDFADLPDVDPETFQATGANIAAWQAALREVYAARADMIVSAEVVDDRLMVTTADGDTIDAGNVRGLPGSPGLLPTSQTVADVIQTPGPGREALEKKIAPVSRRQEVATNVYANPRGAATLTAVQTHRTPHYVGNQCTDLVIGYGNHQSASGVPIVETPTGSTYTVKASIEIGGTIYPLKFNGTPTATIESGGIAYTDPLGVIIPAGSLVWVRTYLSATAPGWVGNARGRNSGAGSAAGDLTAGGAIAGADTNQYAPFSISGRTLATAPAVAIVGDSIAFGQSDSGGNYGSLDFSTGAASAATASRADGFVSRALGPNIGRVKQARPSQRIDETVGTLNANYFSSPLLRYCTHAITNMGTNDFGYGRSLAQVQAAAVALWTLLVIRGMKVWQTTLSPVTTSTDAWATVGNQTPTSYEAGRVGFNDWVRAGAPIHPTTRVPVAAGTPGALTTGQTGHPLSGYFDVADTVETARNSGRWKVPAFTGDGLHPAQTGHIAMAAAIDTARLA